MNPPTPSRDTNARAPRPTPGRTEAEARRVYRAAAPAAASRAGRPAAAGHGGAPLTAAEGQARVRARKLKRKRRAIRAVTAALSLIAIMLSGVFAAYTTLAQRVSGGDTVAGSVPEEHNTATVFPEYAGKGILNFVVCGIGYDDPEKGADGEWLPEDTIGNTDMILYCHYDTVNGKLAIMQIPRDVFVGEEPATGGTYKINGLYRHSEDPNNRVAALTEVLVEQFRLPVDFYVTIDMKAVKEIVEIRGSIDVYVPVDIDDPRNPDTFIAQGWHPFGPQDIEILLRNRYSTSYNQQYDIARLRTQQYFYSALFREFKKLAPQDLIMWMNVLTYRIRTDHDLIGLGSLATKALSLEGGDITFVRPPCGPATYGGSACVALVADETADLLNEYFRAEGQVIGADGLDIHELPMDMGVVPAEVKTMGDIQSTEAKR